MGLENITGPVTGAPVSRGTAHGGFAVGMPTAAQTIGGQASGAGPGESMRDQMRKRQMERRYITQAGTFVQQAVTVAATTKTITFDREESDTSYGVAAIPNWGTTCYVSARTTTDLTLTFGTAAPANATVDVLTFRS